MGVLCGFFFNGCNIFRRVGCSKKENEKIDGVCFNTACLYKITKPSNADEVSAHPVDLWQIDGLE